MLGVMIDMKFIKMERALTPSGYGDNGKWETTSLELHIPDGKFKELVVEEVDLKTGAGKVRCLRLTLDGTSWNVVYNLAFVKRIRNASVEKV